MTLHPTIKWLVRPAAIVALLAGTTFAGAAAASATPTYANSINGTVIARNGLAVRKDFDLSRPLPPNAPINYYLPYADQETVYCWTTGPNIDGPYGWTNAWDVIYFSEGHAGVVSDAWLYTGGDIRTQVNRC